MRTSQKAPESAIFSNQRIDPQRGDAQAAVKSSLNRAADKYTYESGIRHKALPGLGDGDEPSPKAGQTVPNSAIIECRLPL